MRNLIRAVSPCIGSNNDMNNPLLLFSIGIQVITPPYTTRVDRGIFQLCMYSSGTLAGHQFNSESLVIMFRPIVGVTPRLFLLIDPNKTTAHLRIG